MAKSLTAAEQNVAAYYDAQIDTFLEPYAFFEGNPLGLVAYQAYESFWRGEAKRFGRLLLDRNVLSLGTGTASDESMFSKRGIGYVGIDISATMLQGAIRRTPRPTVVRMNMRNLGFANNSFGGVWAFDSLAHVPKEDIPEVLSEAYRVTRPGGSFYATTHLGEGVGYYNGIGVQHWQPEEFEGRLSDAGFQITSLQPEYNGHSIYIAQTTKS